MELREFHPSFYHQPVPQTPIVNSNSPQTSQSLMEPILSMKCKLCTKFYREDQNANDACRYHPGLYKSVYKSMIAVGSLHMWSCCKGDLRDEPGCKVGAHVEDVATTEKMKQFEVRVREQQAKRGHRSTSRQSPGDETEDLIDFNFENEKEKPKSVPQPNTRQKLDINTKIVDQENEKFIDHTVKLTDTLRGLSIKYNVSVEEMKSLNRLSKDEDIWTRLTLKIPFRGQVVEEPTAEEKKQHKRDMKNRLIKRFYRITNCSNESEAKYYLKTNRWLFDQAMNEYKVDKTWEANNPMPHTFSVKV